MTFALKLTHDEPRLVYLALVYHLGRPGSELDPATKMPAERGLREMKVALGADLARASAVIELDQAQYRKLLSAIYGCVTELRVHHMRGGAPSTVDRFTDTAVTLFPRIQADPEEALSVSEAMVMLHRRMDRAVRSAVEAPEQRDAGNAAATDRKGKRGWPFRR
ncbi:MAG: hypothetical protein AAB349_03120 [Chloroflexota bacterium]